MTQWAWRPPTGRSGHRNRIRQSGKLQLLRKVHPNRAPCGGLRRKVSRSMVRGMDYFVALEIAPDVWEDSGRVFASPGEAERFAYKQSRRTMVSCRD